MEQKDHGTEALLTEGSITEDTNALFNALGQELQGPVDAMLGIIREAKEEKSAVRLHDALAQMERACEDIRSIVRDAAKTSGVETQTFSLHREWCKLDTVAKPCLALYEPRMREKSIRFSYMDKAFWHENIECFFDPLRLRQVLMQLLGTAYRLTPEGGSVHFDIRRQDVENDIATDVVTLRCIGGGTYGAVEAARACAPLADEAGAMGLAITKNIVVQAGGTFRITNIEQGGTEIEFSLPYRFRTVRLQPQYAACFAGVRLNKKKILLAEDIEINAAIVCRMLQRESAAAVVASNGKVALERFSASALNEYDAILMDIRMPVMDGLQATAAIRTLDRPDAKTIPIIAVSANASPEDEKKSLAAGMNAHLAKPLEPETLYEALETFCCKRPAGQA